MKVTFDTNTFDKAVRPYLYSKDAENKAFVAVHEAIRGGQINAFICETMITLEGIKVDDRAAVFGGSMLRTQINAKDEADIIHINLNMEQPLRKPIHAKQAERFSAAFAMGVKLLGAPRIGMPRVEFEGSGPYATETESALSARLNRSFDLAKEIETRGLGIAQAISLADKFATKSGPHVPWFSIFNMASDIHEIREVAWAIAEWADGDSIAAHYGYGNDLFCTTDHGKAAVVSVLDVTNRAWLSRSYGIEFATLSELATRLRRA